MELDDEQVMKAVDMVVTGLTRENLIPQHIQKKAVTSLATTLLNRARRNQINGLKRKRRLQNDAPDTALQTEVGELSTQAEGAQEAAEGAETQQTQTMDQSLYDDLTNIPNPEEVDFDDIDWNEGLSSAAEDGNKH